MAEKPKKKKAPAIAEAKAGKAVKKAVKKKAATKSAAKKAVKKKKAASAPVAPKKPAKKAVIKKAAVKSEEVGLEKIVKNKAIRQTQGEKTVKKKTVKKKAAAKKAVTKKVLQQDRDVKTISTATVNNNEIESTAPEEVITSASKDHVFSKTSSPVKKKSSPKPAVRLSKTEIETEEGEIEAAKFYIPVDSSADQEGYVSSDPMDEGELPDRYQDNTLILMARDPFWCYAYWDVSDDFIAQKKAEMKSSWGEGHLTIRIYDISDVDFNGQNANKYMDVSVTEESRNWYINVWESGRKYIADLGLKSPEGDFMTITRSNAINAPLDRVSDFSDEEWMEMDEDYDEIFKVSSGGATAPDGKTRTVGGSENMTLPGMMSSDTVSSFSSPAGGGAGKPRLFWLRADTELILYGATEPDASVTVKGVPVELGEDGTFSVRYKLNDGLLGLPVTAVSNDGVDTITIKFEVTRKTEK